MTSPYLNRRDVLRLFALAGGALVAGVGCGDEVRPQQVRQQPQEEKVLCRAYA